MRLKTGISALLLAFPLLLCPFSSAFADLSPDVDKTNTAYIEEMSNIAGVGGGDYVATLASTMAIKYGVAVSREGSTIKIGASLSENLAAMKPSAKYPDWDTLDSTQQSNYADEDDYNAARFNDLMSSYGLGDSYERWESYASGEEEGFDFIASESMLIQDIGDAALNFINRTGNSIGTMLGLIKNDEAVSEYVGVNKSVELDPTKDENMPYSSPVTLAMASRFWVSYGNTAYYRVIETSVPVYVLVLAADNGSGGKYCRLIFMAKTPFTWGYTTGRDPNAVTVTLNKNSSQRENYYYESHYGSFTPFLGSSVGITDADSSKINGISNYYSLMDYIMGLGSTGIGDADPNISDYPSDISNDVNVTVYIPDSGITPEMPWNAFLTLNNGGEGGEGENTADLAEIIRLLRQFQFYATGQLKVHDEGVFDSITDIGSDINNIVSILQNWHSEDNASQIIGDFDFPEYKTKAETLEETLDDILPFGAIFLVSGLVGSIADINVISEPKIEIPWNFFPDHEEEIVIDVSWIEDGRNMIHAFMIFTLLLSLTMLTIGFVKNEV